MARRRKTWVDYMKARAVQVWGWCPERRAALDRAYIGAGYWRCEKCDAKPLPKGERQVDHVEPVEPVAGWQGWDVYFERRFVTRDKLEVLCLECHHAKSATENALRRKAKKAVTDGKV
jgi:hypothetical protein